MRLCAAAVLRFDCAYRDISCFKLCILLYIVFRTVCILQYCSWFKGCVGRSEHLSSCWSLSLRSLKWVSFLICMLHPYIFTVFTFCICGSYDSWLNVCLGGVWSMRNMGCEEKQKWFFFLLEPNMCTSSYNFCVQGERENVTVKIKVACFTFSVCWLGVWSYWCFAWCPEHNYIIYRYALHLAFGIKVCFPSWPWKSRLVANHLQTSSQ